MSHPSYELALEIEIRWPNFPTDTSDYLTLALWLAEHGACTRCKKAFRAAWENYIADG